MGISLHRSAMIWRKWAARWHQSFLGKLFGTWAIRRRLAGKKERLPAAVAAGRAKLALGRGRLEGADDGPAARGGGRKQSGAG